jgi:DNA-binding LytR/AlgR family response regulator
VDYLLKPIKYERFVKALAKLKNMDGPVPVDVPIRLSGMTEPMMATDIHYVEAMGNYLKLHLSKKVVIVHGTLKHIEQLLKPHGFLRCHKTFIVQLAVVDRLDNDTCL